MDQAEQLRRKIQQQEENNHVARIIAVTSGKGGVGKSSLSVNLGVQLQKKGKRVIIIDADFGLANIEVMLGVRPKYNISDMLFNGKTLDDIINRGPLGIGFMSGGSGIKDLVDLSKEQLKTLVQKLAQLDEIADFIIIDTGAGISDTVLEFLICSPEILIVTTPEPTSITDAYALLKTLNRHPEFEKDKKQIRIVTNRVNTVKEGKELYSKLVVVINKFLNVKTSFLGAIPQDMNVSRAIIEQKPVSLVYPNSIASKSFLDIASVMCDDSIKEEQKENKKSGIASVFSSLFKIRK